MDSNKSSLGAYFGIALGVFLILVVFVGACASVTSFKGVEPAEACIVKEGGPFDGRSIKEVRQPAEGPKFIGPFNKQQCFPATERQIRLTDNDQGDRDEAAYKTPTVDAVQVHIDGQLRFALNTDPDTLKDFYRRYGVRTFDGKHPYDGDEGWTNFLRAVVIPILQTSIREVVGEYPCIELNNQCQYVQNIEAATKGDVKQVHQKLEIIGSTIAEKFQANLKATLGGDYFDPQRIRFNLVRAGFDPSVQREITASQAKRAELAKAQLEAQRQQREAHGKLLVARENAKAIQVKARSYSHNPDQAAIDKLHALCGDVGCTSLQVLGGNVTKLIR